MVSLSQVTVSFGGFILFNDVSFLVNPKERVGLVGKNGAGKSTLLKLIVGQMSASSGEISIPRDLSVGYLPQQMDAANSRSVLDETMTAFNSTLKLAKDIEKISKELEQRTDYESDDYAKLINSLTEKSERFSLLGGDSLDAKVEITLTGLGFKRTDFSRPTSEFSGGWRMRIELAKILLQAPGILLLDEPTNHLDIESIQWLEDYLKTYPGALILISHDRAFLDNVTDRTIELSLGKAYDYRVSYSKYVELRNERRQQQLAAYKNQQKQIEETKDFVERFRYKATKANQVQSRIKQLDKIDVIEVDDEDNSALNIRFPEAARAGDLVVKVNNVSKTYGTNTVFSKANFDIVRGEKVAFVGRNGEGKTTLSKIIIGEIDYQGEMKLGHNVSIGYFAQNQDELMNPNQTVLETIDRVAVGAIRTKIRDILGAFLFRGEDVDKKISVLSGGERNRLAMVKLMLEPHNLLILDEPTNHLDMRSKDILKEALATFKGTVIVVSHDREFLNGLISKVYEFRDGRVNEHIGGIYDFLAKRKLENLKELETQKEQEKTERSNSGISDRKKEWLDRKEQDKAIRKVASQVEKIETSISDLEKLIAEKNAILSNPSNACINEEFFAEYEELKKELNKTMHKWEQLHYEMEILKEED